jgi:hypothetical protein
MRAGPSSVLFLQAAEPDGIPRPPTIGLGINGPCRSNVGSVRCSRSGASRSESRRGRNIGPCVHTARPSGARGSFQYFNFRSDRFKGICNLAAALGCPLHVDTRRRPCANRSHSLTTWRILTPLVPALSFWVQWKFRVFVLRMSMCKSGTYPEPDTMPSITLKPRNFR